MSELIKHFLLFVFVALSPLWIIPVIILGTIGAYDFCGVCVGGRSYFGFGDDLNEDKSIINTILNWRANEKA